MFVYDSSVAEVPGAPSDSERITGEANDSLANVVNDGLPNESIEEVEETLESHEVIELQAFIKRKEWIEEKIRFLENLPPIEVFAGVEESLNAPEQTAGSATRSQLNDWMIEHDRIEKETEIFDSGDLKKLKKFTKVATQRNLSPEDTDLIELTLTTLLSLDKLLHLLRERSEQLELLNLRLVWEEQRTGAYSSLREILTDFESFLSTRARWSPNIYYTDKTGIVSYADNAAWTNPVGGNLSDNSDGFSRSTRFRLAEELSKDAAQFSSRVTSLRHGHVSVAGKVLDKLIDDSRKPVPDIILDEQDRLEEKCVKDLEAIGKFGMAIVLQWKRADEVYIETKKDNMSLESLLNDISAAEMRHPSRKSDFSFSARLDLIAKRISSRPNPTLSTTALPHPVHHLFPDQTLSNENIVTILTNTLDTAQKNLERASESVRTYRAGCDAIDAAEVARKDLKETRAKLSSILYHFQNGFLTDDGDGTPPDLTNKGCVSPLRHSAYLAMLPSLTEEAKDAEKITNHLLQQARLTALHLGRSQGIDSTYSQSYQVEIDNTEETLDKLMKARNEASSCVSKLREVRHIWSTLDDVSNSLDICTGELGDALVRHRWKQQIGGEAPPLTPESPHSTVFTVLFTPELVMQTLEQLQTKMSKDVVDSLNHIQQTLPVVLFEHLQSRYQDASGHLSDLRRMHELFLDVRKQTSVMEGIREEVHDLESRIDEHKISYDEYFQQMLSSAEDRGLDTKELSLEGSTDAVYAEVHDLTESLPRRVPFISRYLPAPSGTTVESTATESSNSFLSRLPFDLAVIDRIVRSDSNAYATRLTSGMSSLLLKKSLVLFYRMARCMDKCLTEVCVKLDGTSARIEEIAVKLQSCREQLEGGDDLSSILVELDSLRSQNRLQIEQIFADLRDNIIQMRASPGVQDDITNLSTLTTRAAKLDELDLKFHRLFVRVDSLRNEVDIAKRAAATRNEIVSTDAEATVMYESSENVDNEPAERDEDVFLSPRGSYETEVDNRLPLVQSLRKRLKSLGLVKISRATDYTGPALIGSLPSIAMFDSFSPQLLSIVREASCINSEPENPSIAKEVQKLNGEIDESQQAIQRVERLAHFSRLVVLCDNTFSEFLDCIDNFPEQPLNPQNRPAFLDDDLSPEEHLSERLSYTKGIVGDMTEHFRPVADDQRAITEYNRLKQTWDELTEMALEKLNARSSRPPSSSAVSSGRVSRSSLNDPVPRSKQARFPRLSVSSRSRGGFLVPSTQRRSVSSSTAKDHPDDVESRTSLNVSRTSLHGQRSVSGPIRPPTSSSLYSSTFSSRQRTTSVSSSTSSVMSGGKAHGPAGSTARRMSSAFSDLPRIGSPPVPVTSRGTWSRAPRQSFAFKRPETPEENLQKRKKKYVANPKNKLDVAVGDVVNNLPVDINVEVVADTWKDKSGKYWIGGNEPKLCFCRILRSQTVMVRVGGGWTELSKFIKDHFADLFRLIPESPPRQSPKVERWISASTLRNSMEDAARMSPRTPEHSTHHLPSFALSTPDGTRTQTIRSSSPIASPLTPLQFMRKADINSSEMSLSSIVLSTSLSSRPKSSVPNTPAKQSVWRP